MVLQNSKSKRGTSEKDGEKQRRNEEKSVERRKPCGVCIERITRTGNATSFLLRNNSRHRFHPHRTLHPARRLSSNYYSE